MTMQVRFNLKGLVHNYSSLLSSWDEDWWHYLFKYSFEWKHENADWNSD